MVGTYIALISSDSEGRWFESSRAYVKIPRNLWTVPQTKDKEKKNPAVDSNSLRGLAREFNRSEAVFERNSLEIVEIDILRNELFDLNP